MTTSEVIFDFEKLEAYREADAAVSLVLKGFGKWPARYRWLENQLGRAALSIPSNIAEGNGREGVRDKIQFFRIARGSLNECVTGLEAASHLGLVSAETRSEIRSRLHRVVMLLGGLVRSLRRGAVS